ncbi:MAG: ATP-binding protein, partial [Clostridia bacterium]|nr:ATP-binding protein [Clostridia bacterium]
MKELSLNILDIAQNSIHADASFVQILLNETDRTLEIAIIDDGK